MQTISSDSKGEMPAQEGWDKMCIFMLIFDNKKMNFQIYFNMNLNTEFHGIFFILKIAD